MNEALIVSRKIIPAHQLATLMEENNFYPRVDSGKNACAEKLAQYLSVLVVDIDDPEIRGIEIACRYLALKPELAWFALCTGGNPLSCSKPDRSWLAVSFSSRSQEWRWTASVALHSSCMAAMERPLMMLGICAIVSGIVCTDR